MTRFTDLALDDSLQRAVADAGYDIPTPIQAQAIPHLLEGRDLLGCARTGTGKTAAFALPILQRLSHGERGGIRCLVLVPTRELAAQVAESFKTYGSHLRLSVAVIYGGVSQGSQARALKAGVDILVATPGRLVDLMNQRIARLDQVEVLVLDEADHMLDLGFIPDVRRVIKAIPPRRQTLLFSATMPPAIADLADGLLKNPVKVMVTPPATTVELVDQSVHHVSGYDKPDLLAQILLQPEVESALVFTRTKRGADRVAKRLAASGIPALAIHGNKAQNVRERTLRSFKDGSSRVLVATDVAARGIDVDGISHVINYELPHVPETYVHRIGRTGRAGAAGIAVALCADEERSLLRDIEKLTKRPIRIAKVPPVMAVPRSVPAAEPEAPYRDPRRTQQHARPKQARPQAKRGGQPQRAASSRSQPARGPATDAAPHAAGFTRAPQERFSRDGRSAPAASSLRDTGSAPSRDTRSAPSRDTRSAAPRDHRSKPAPAQRSAPSSDLIPRERGTRAAEPRVAARHASRDDRPAPAPRATAHAPQRSSRPAPEAQRSARPEQRPPARSEQRAGTPFVRATPSHRIDANATASRRGARRRDEEPTNGDT